MSSSTPVATSGKMFLSYDLRAIQSYIFRVPKLKYIVGGSALVDRFDRQAVPALCQKFGCTDLFSGGGKGTIECSDATCADALENALRVEAHRFALDIRFGRNHDFSDAAHGVDRLYSFVPELCDGPPCKLSGLYPVASGTADGVHPSIRKRIFDRSEDVFRHFERRLLGLNLDVGPGLAGRALRFLSNIEADCPEGHAGLASLGRSRWAIICMDGNDMGRQFREAAKQRPDALPQWVRSMSQSLDNCAVAAARSGIERVVRLWSKDCSNSQIDACECDGEIVVPIRPLVVGGDDIIVLCHPAYAFDFVESACTAWADASQREAKVYGIKDGLALWPATKSGLTISAGVLFCPATLPMHAAVPYAEMLLASAKHRGRGRAGDHDASPSTIDWESVVESMLDTPAARRARELRFRDLDVTAGTPGEIVELTMRPYLLSDFMDIKERAEDLRSIPRAIRNDVLPALRQGRQDRSLFRKRIAKNHHYLNELLDEDTKSQETAWTLEKQCLGTWLPDALSILEETERHAKGDSHV